MNTIQRQKQIADAILKKIETFDPTAIVAGGAPRDWYLNRLCSDVDVFCHWRPDLQMGYFDKLLLGLGFNVASREYKNSNSLEYIRNPNLKFVYEGKFKGILLNIVFTYRPTFHGVVDSFPFGICRAWYKNGEIHITREFRESLSGKTLFLLDPTYADGDRYINKIRAKFPDFEYISQPITKNFERYYREMWRDGIS